MALIDKFLKKTLAEQEADPPLNILVCFSKPETGTALCKIANYFTQHKHKNEQISSLHLLEKEEFDKIKSHPEIGATIISDLRLFHFFKSATVALYCLDNPQRVSPDLTVCCDSLLLFEGNGTLTDAAPVNSL